MNNVIGVVALALIIGIVVIATMRPVVQTTYSNGAPTLIVPNRGTQPEVPEIPQTATVSTRCGSLVRPASGVYPMRTLADGACAARRRQSVWLASWLGLALAILILASLLLLLLLGRRALGELSMPR